MHLEDFAQRAGYLFRHVSILVSNWMHLEAFREKQNEFGTDVSILVSNWMHLEENRPFYGTAANWCFNPSF